MIQRQEARERLFPLLGYDLIASRVRNEEGIELGEELGSQMETMQLKPNCDSQNDEPSAWRKKRLERFRTLGGR